MTDARLPRSAGTRAGADGLDLAALRRSYDLPRQELDPFADGAPMPTWIEWFARWFAEAQADPGVVEPNAIQLATTDGAGHAAVRTVLAKAVSQRGLVFYTHYASAKGRDLAAVPWSAAVFAWLAQQRQVRFSGPTERVAREESENYFAQRPRGSQIGAWASPQSSVVADRRELDEAVARAERHFAGVESIPPPLGWGGYRLRPVEVEFWQGRPDRMHERIRFQRVDADADGIPGPDAGAGGGAGAGAGAGTWRIDRLAP